jgi:hypothetical protein
LVYQFEIGSGFQVGKILCATGGLGAVTYDSHWLIRPRWEDSNGFRWKNRLFVDDLPTKHGGFS